MIMNYPLEAWHVEKIRESVSEFGRFLVWNKDGSNRARILIKVRVPDILEIPISHVLCENTNDEGHGHSWTCVIYILQSNLLGGPGGDEDHLPPHGGNPHPIPNLPFGGIWEDADFPDIAALAANDPPAHNVAPINHNVTPAAEEELVIQTPPQSPPVHHHNAHDLQPAIEAADSFSAMHRLVSDIMHNAPVIMEQLNPEQINAMRVQLVDVHDGVNVQKKSVLTIFTSANSATPKPTCTITEVPDYDSKTDTISETSYQTDELNTMMDTPICSIDVTHSEIPLPANKRKKACARNVSEVRHSNRLTDLSAGFKDKDAADKAAGKDVMKEKPVTKKISKTLKKSTKKNLNVPFTAEVMDITAPPPPELPLSTVQAIGVQQCQIPPSEVSDEKLLAKCG
jgi:hypothetical protein